jgi:hypothetical protein
MTYKPDDGYRGGLTIADHIGCATGFVFFFTIGVAVLFGVTWGEAHAPGDAWTGWRIPLAWIGVGGATFLIYWGTKRLVDLIRR